MLLRICWVLIALAAPALAEPPRVLSMTPDHGDTGIDPALATIRFEFDQDMATTGASICGGGPKFPKVTARPKWESPRILVLGVQLEQEHVYELSLNCPAAQNTKSTNGEAAEITPLLFRTGTVGAAAPPVLTREGNAVAVEALRRAIDLRYSYRDLRVKDWDAAFGGAKGSMLAATSRAAFARAAGRMLAGARDLHMTLSVGEARFPTFRVSLGANVDAALLRQLVPEWRIVDQYLNTGMFEDGIAYISIRSWPGDERALAAAHAALDSFAGARGLIVDVRANGGGDEPAAARFASRFVRERSVYSRNRYRDGEGGVGPGSGSHDRTGGGKAIRSSRGGADGSRLRQQLRVVPAHDAARRAREAGGRTVIRQLGEPQADRTGKRGHADPALVGRPDARRDGARRQGCAA